MLLTEKLRTLSEEHCGGFCQVPEWRLAVGKISVIRFGEHHGSSFLLARRA